MSNLEWEIEHKIFTPNLCFFFLFFLEHRTSRFFLLGIHFFVDVSWPVFLDAQIPVFLDSVIGLPFLVNFHSTIEELNQFLVLPLLPPAFLAEP